MQNAALLIGAGEFTGQGGLAAVSPDDLSRNRNRSIIPRFYTKHVKKVDGTFLEVEYVELLVPGDAKSSPCHLVDDRLRAMYPDSYRAFKENREETVIGTPVEVWLAGRDNEGIILMLKSLHLRSVEDVAGISDQVINTMGMGGREIRDRAQRFLAAQRNADSANKVVEQEEEIAQLKQRLASLESGDKAAASDVDEDTDEDEAEDEGEKKVGPVVKLRAADKKGKLWAVMIDGIQDGDPMSKKQAERRMKELQEENS